jgi:5-methylcytosine-specific restriction endonuclease McrA
MGSNPMAVLLWGELEDNAMNIKTDTREQRALFYNSMEWRHLRDWVMQRDNYECQMCKADGKVTTQADSVLEVDHIKELEYYPDSALDPDNLRTLCKDCHNKRHHRFNYAPKDKQHKPKNKWSDDERWD